MVGLRRTALAGYGLSAGHDAWRFTKRNSGTLLLFILACGAAYLPFKGARELTRGHNRGLAATLLRTFCAGLLTIFAGAILGFGLSFAIVLILGGTYEAALSFGTLLTTVVASVATLVGLVVGAFERPKRTRGFAISRANAKFMSEVGLRETGGTDITHYDSDGNALRFLEAHVDRLVFLAVGRRSRRAYINLDTDGRMLAYSGVVTV